MSAFMISKTHISAQKPHERHLNAKVRGPFFVQTTSSNNEISGSSSHRHFVTNLMLITARSFTTTQRLHRYKFTLVESIKLFSALPVPGCCPLRRTPFLMLYACAHVVSFPTKGHSHWSGSETSAHVKSRELSTVSMHGLFPL